MRPSRGQAELLCSIILSKTSLSIFRSIHIISGIMSFFLIIKHFLVQFCQFGTFGYPPVYFMSPHNLTLILSRKGIRKKWKSYAPQPKKYIRTNPVSLGKRPQSIFQIHYLTSAFTRPFISKYGQNIRKDNEKNKYLTNGLQIRQIVLIFAISIMI